MTLLVLKGGSDMPTLEAVQKLFFTYRDKETSDSDFDNAEERLKEILPAGLFTALDEIKDPRSPEFEATYCGEKPKATVKAVEANLTGASPEAGQRVPGGYPELLAWPPNKEGVIEFPDYAIDFRGIPHGLGNRGRGRKKGELSMDRFYKGKTFICRYRLTDLDGERKNLPPHFCARVRTHAEQAFKKTNLAYLN